MSVEQYGARLLDEVQEESLDEVSDGNLSAHSWSTQPCSNHILLYMITGQQLTASNQSYCGSCELLSTTRQRMY